MFNHFSKVITVLILMVGMVPTAMPNHTIEIALKEKRMRIEGLKDTDTLETLKHKFVENRKKEKEYYPVSTLYFWQQEPEKDEVSFINDNLTIKELLSLYNPLLPLNIKSRNSWGTITVILPDGKNFINIPIASGETVQTFLPLIKEAFKYDIDPTDRAIYEASTEAAIGLYALDSKEPLKEDSLLTSLYMPIVLSLGKPFPAGTQKKDLLKKNEISEILRKMARFAYYPTLLADNYNKFCADKDASRLSYCLSQCFEFSYLLPQLNIHQYKVTNIDELPLFDASYRSSIDKNQYMRVAFIHSIGLLREVINKLKTDGSVNKQFIISSSGIIEDFYEEMQTKLNQGLATQKDPKSVNEQFDKLNKVVAQYEFYAALDLLPDDEMFNGKGKKITADLKSAYQPATAITIPMLKLLIKDAQEAKEKQEKQENEMKEAQRLLKQAWVGIENNQFFTLKFPDKTQELSKLKSQLEQELRASENLKEPFDFEKFKQRADVLQRGVTKAIEEYRDSAQKSKGFLKQYTGELFIGGTVVTAGVAIYLYRSFKHNQKVKAAVNKLKELSPQERKKMFNEIIQEYGLKGYEKDIEVQLAKAVEVQLAQ